MKSPNCYDHINHSKFILFEQYSFKGPFLSVFIAQNVHFSLSVCGYVKLLYSGSILNTAPH